MKNEINRNYRHMLDLQMFAEGDPPQDPPADPPADPDKRTVTMTQAELDALIGREKGRATKKFADYDDLKAERDRLKAEDEARKAAELTETERLQAQNAEAERKVTEATEARDKALAAANSRVIKAEFRLLAKEAGIRGDALDDAFKLADLSDVKVDEDGNVEGVADVITALKAAKPYLAEVKKEPRDIGGGSGGGEPKPDKTKEQLLAAAAEKAKRSGKIEDQVAYTRLKQELEK
jgi:hypothetical protein